MNKASARLLSEVAMSAALSMVLSLLVFYRLPQGGTVTFAMLPIFFLAYRRGVWWGLASGVVAGALQMIVDPYFVHPIQVTLDYFLAWGALGLAGLFSHMASKTPAGVVLGLVVGTTGRFVFHYLSGIWFFAQFAPAGMALWYYVSTYILSHLLPEAALCLVLLVPSLRRLYVTGR